MKFKFPPSKGPIATGETIDGKTRKGAEIAAQLIPILSAWGITRDNARSAAAILGTTLSSMTDAEYEAAARGMRIKGGDPAPILDTGNGKPN